MQIVTFAFQWFNSDESSQIEDPDERLQVFKYRGELAYHRGEYQAALQAFTDALGKTELLRL